MNLFFESLLFAQFEFNLQLDKYFQAQPLFRYWFKFLKVRTEDNCCSFIHYSTISYFDLKILRCSKFPALLFSWDILKTWWLLHISLLDYSCKPLTISCCTLIIEGWRWRNKILINPSNIYAGILWVEKCALRQLAQVWQRQFLSRHWRSSRVRRR